MEKWSKILGSLGQCKFVARDIVDAPNPKRVNKQVLTTHDQFCSDLPLELFFDSEPNPNFPTAISVIAKFYEGRYDRAQFSSPEADIESLKAHKAIIGAGLNGLSFETHKRRLFKSQARA